MNEGQFWDAHAEKIYIKNIQQFYVEILKTMQWIAVVWLHYNISLQGQNSNMTLRQRR